VHRRDEEEADRGRRREDDEQYAAPSDGTHDQDGANEKQRAL
jgi:hypothetical protein